LPWQAAQYALNICSPDAADVGLAGTGLIFGGGVSCVIPAVAARKTEREKRAHMHIKRPFVLNKRGIVILLRRES
jgi:hypothetical protein